jgi:P4 family phage/plasmid primase-like protien
MYDPKKFATIVEKAARKLTPGDDDTILADPSLDEAFVSLVCPSVGHQVKEVEVTAWANGSMHTENGNTDTKTWPELAEEITELALSVIPKGRQPYFCQGVSPSGKRNNVSMSHMTLLAFDCDDNGPWDKLKEALDLLGLAYIFYESSSAKPGVDRWRCMIPLSTPFDVSTPEKQHAWKHAYRCIRTLLGHVGGLTLEGFDTCLERVSQPVYVGCRRSEDTLARVVLWKAGASFDLAAFAKRIPAAPTFIPATDQTDDFPEIGYLFQAAGWLGEQRGNKICVRCPWNDDHSTPLRDDEEPTDKAVIFFPKEGSTAGIFSCFGHGTRTITEIKAALPADVVAKGEQIANERRMTAFKEYQEAHPEALSPVLPDQVLVHKWDELGNGQRFARDYNHVCRYDRDRGQWMVYDGKRWQVDKGDTLVHQYAMESVKSMYSLMEDMDPDLRKTYKKFVTASSSYRGISNLLKVARAVPGMSVGADIWDKDPFTLNVENGTLDLKSGKLRPHSPSDLLTKLCPVEYLPHAKSPVWDAFLARIFPSLGMREYMARVFGYTSSGDTSEHCMHVLHGAGSNGKSTMVSMLGHVLGDYFSSTDAGTFLAQRSDAPRNDLAALVGARMVSASETDVGRKLSEATVKVCTGDDSVTCRFLHKEFFTYVPQYKVFLMSNSRPEITGGDEGIWRRMRLVPFDVSIPEHERDHKLKDKLRAEASGVLRWVVDGFKAWQANGLDQPAEVREATKEYREDMDPTTEWFAECCIVAPGDHELFESTKMLYQSYRAYVLMEGAEEPIKQQQFYAFLNSRGLVQKSKKVAGKVIRGRAGIMLRTPRNVGKTTKAEPS